MKIKSLKALFLAAAALAILSCITVNIYFPEAEVKKAAEDIVNDVRGTDQQKKDEVKKGAVAQADGFSFFPALYAQQATEVSTPGIRALKEAMKARAPQLAPHYDAGRIGEALTGLVQTLNEDGLSMQDRSVFRKLVNDENRDRKDLYGQVATALKVDPSKLGEVQKIFADQWISTARPGWMVQKPDGSWAKK